MNIRNYLYINSYDDATSTAYMRINKPIGDGSDEISGTRFTQELDTIIANGAKKVVFLINSPGGSVIHGMEIFSAIQDAIIDTETRVVGLAASIAGVIAQAGKIRTIKPYALFMAHSPSPAKGTTASANVLKLAYDAIKSMLTSRSKMTEERITQVLSTDTFMSAQEAFNEGLFDQVLDYTHDDPKITNNMTSEEVMNVVNSFNFNVKKQSMSKLNEILGLANEASEESQVCAMKDIIAKAKSAESLIAKVAELEANALIVQRERATSLIENAIKEGKLTFDNESSKTIAIDNAVTNYDSTKMLIDGIKVVRMANHIVPAGAQEGEDRAKWSYADWSKNDEQGLARMKNENPVKFDKLFNEYAN